MSSWYFWLYMGDDVFCRINFCRVLSLLALCIFSCFECVSRFTHPLLLCDFILHNWHVCVKSVQLFSFAGLYKHFVRQNYDFNACYKIKLPGFVKVGVWLTQKLTCWKFSSFVRSSFISARLNHCRSTYELWKNPLQYWYASINKQKLTVCTFSCKAWNMSHHTKVKGHCRSVLSLYKYVCTCY